MEVERVTNEEKGSSIAFHKQTAETKQGVGRGESVQRAGKSSCLFVKMTMAHRKRERGAMFLGRTLARVGSSGTLRGSELEAILGQNKIGP